MGSLQAGGEGGLWANYWLSKSMFLLGAGTSFLSPQGAVGWGLVGKLTPLPPSWSIVHSPCGLTSIHTSELAGAVCSRPPSTGSKNGIQDMQLKVDETLILLAQCSPGFVWVCSLVTDALFPGEFHLSGRKQLCIML